MVAIILKQLPDTHSTYNNFVIMVDLRRKKTLLFAVLDSSKSQSVLTLNRRAMQQHSNNIKP